MITSIVALIMLSILGAATVRNHRMQQIIIAAIWGWLFVAVLLGLMRVTHYWRSTMTNDKPKFGATGQFPEGKIVPHDEGELKFGIAHDENGMVHIDFGTPVHSFMLSQEMAITFARLILKHCGIKKVEITL